MKIIIVHTLLADWLYIPIGCIYKEIYSVCFSESYDL